MRNKNFKNSAIMVSRFPNSPELLELLKAKLYVGARQIRR